VSSIGIVKEKGLEEWLCMKPVIFYCISSFIGIHFFTNQICKEINCSDNSFMKSVWMLSK
jgi:hypothetical protein